MAAPVVFESLIDLQRKREEKRKAQALVLQKAKDEHDKKERKRERWKLQGDDKWILPAVSNRIQAEDTHVSSKRKKEKKKQKKTKKEKKTKHKTKRRSSTSDLTSADEEDEMEWVEYKQTKPSTATQKTAVTGSNLNQKTKRDDWMTADPVTIATYSRDDLRRQKEAAEGKTEAAASEGQKELMDNPGQSVRELNPYWKDGGTGLPAAKDNTPAVKVGTADGGAGWLRRAHRRLVQRAEEEGRSVSELAAERWGSLEKYHERLAKAESAERREGGERRKDRYENPGRHEHDERTQRRRGRSPSGRGRESDPRTSLPRSGERKPASHSSLTGLRGMFRKPGEGSPDRARTVGRSRSERRRGDDCHPSWRKKPFGRQSSDDEKEGRTKEDVSSETGSTERNRDVPSWKKKKPSPDGSRNLDTRVRQDRDREACQSPSRTPSDAPSWGDQPKPGSSEGMPKDSPTSSSDPDSDSSSDAMGDGRSPTPPPRILSEAEMNQLGAKIVKAELFGNEELARQLKSQIDTARQAKANLVANRQQPMSVQQQRTHEGHTPAQEEVVLTRLDKTGQAWPVPEQTGLASSSGGGGRRKNRPQNISTHGKDGERERYFGDDDQQELRDMVRKERMTSSEDQLRLFNKVANKALKKLHGDHTLDDMFVSVAAKKSARSEETRERDVAIAQHHKMAASIARCPYCLDSAEMQKHLIIALGNKVYLCLPANQSLTDGHCLIVPMQHSVASTVLDEDVWNEIQIYRKGLTRMFEDQNKSAIFLETCLNPRSSRHMAIECVPIPKDIGDSAPIYFKKAIQESESEWSQNKKLVDTSKKDIRRSVPKGFPYFSVDFGLNGGYAHVIEDEQSFPHYFGKEIIGGMMDVEPQLWRKPRRQNFADQRRKVLRFGEWWTPFDWTQRIGKD